ncbi:MAG: hypothetical protein KDC80_26105 [Saprospiraceae bacterium]|nr:hypothetical protein [Saprospiraceae bacterium]
MKLIQGGGFIIWVLITNTVLAQNDSLIVDTAWRKTNQLILIEDHNRGEISHPYELIQGRSAGFHITHPGGNPFEPYIIRARGQNTMYAANTLPRIFLDDMPVENLHYYHVFNINSVATEASAAQNAIHGVRGMQGSLNFSTNTELKNKLEISYGNTFSGISAQRLTPIPDAKEFVQLGGQDLGENHNFQELVQQNGFEQQHNLSIAGRWKNTQVEISGNLRNHKPILKNTNSDNLYSRLSLSQSLWKNRIRLKWNNYQYMGEHVYGAPQAFQFANTFNPTSPIFDNEAPEYGGYYQQQIFQYYNPVSIVDQVHRSATETGSLNQYRASIKILPKILLGINYSLEKSDKSGQSWMPSTSYFNSYNGQGYMTESKGNLKSQWLDTYVRQNFSFGNFQLTGKSGYSFQQYTRKIRELEAFGFTEEISSDTDPWQASNKSTTNFGEAHHYIRFYSTQSLVYKNLFSLDLTANYSGSSRLGINRQWGLFYGFSSDLNLNELMNLQSHNSFGLNLNFGRVGNIPMADNLSEYIFDQSYDRFLHDGNYIKYVTFRHDRNPNLSWENKTEWGFGLQKGIWKNKLILQYQVFYSHASDLLDKVYISQGFSQPPEQWQNPYGIKNRGWEITVTGNPVKTKKLDWTLSLTTFRFRSKLSESPEFEQNIGSRCGCGGRAFAPFYIIRDENLGELRTWEETYNGSQYIEVDRGNNGLDLEDYQVTGSIYPKLIFGLQNDLKVGKLTISLRLNAASGHRVVSESRLNYEIRDLIERQNIVKTKYFINQANYYNVFSERFAEKASYLRIDQLYFSYNLSQLTRSFLSGFSLIAGSSNLLTLSKYSGLDPEVRYQEAFPMKGYRELEFSSLSGGFESIQSYPATRSFFIGLQANISK